MPQKQVLKFNLSFFKDIYDELIKGTVNTIYWYKSSDDVVYSFFEEKSIDLARVECKVILLGRYYLTNIEKKASSNVIAKQISNANFDFPQLPLPTMSSASFSEEINIYEMHSDLCKAIRLATKTIEEVFASKWLHFHYPRLFPILDRVVEDVLNRHEGIIEHGETYLSEYYEKFHPYLSEEQYQDRYCWFCFRLLKLRKSLAGKLEIDASSITTKMLDIYLYQYFDKQS